MCGIVGYTGHREAVNILLDGLLTLEYRGYDSAGVSLIEGGRIATIKTKGRISTLREKCESTPLKSHIGIGHTRWATHGEPTDTNAHPHYTEGLSLVHNGIIENYRELKEMLVQNGYEFVSQTDTEVAAKLVDYFYEGDPVKALHKAAEKFDGSYALAVVFKELEDEIFLVKKDSPLIVAIGEGEHFAASDISAVLRYTNKYIVPKDGDIIRVSPTSFKVFDNQLNEVSREIEEANWSVEQAKKVGYEHYMLKEINEQPKAVADTISPRIKNSVPNFDFDGIPSELFEKAERIQIVACGTAMYAGLVGKSLIESLARVPCVTEIASEFRYNDPIFTPNELIIIISQSGETADSLAALRLAKSKGMTVIAVVNVVGSTIAREADYVIKTLAGPEISVASTKAYSVQISVMYLIAFLLAYKKKQITEEELREFTEKLSSIPALIEETLSEEENIKSIAAQLKDTDKMFFIGRGIDYAMSCEGSLKLKEISYIFSEASAAGELKHGHISLVEDKMPLVAICCQEKTAAKTVSNIREVKARGADVIMICKQSYDAESDISNKIIRIPDCEDLFTPLPTAVTLQLLAYHTAVIKGCDVDCPRNLAKSVTVE